MRRQQLFRVPQIVVVAKPALHVLVRNQHRFRRPCQRRALRREVCPHAPPMTFDHRHVSQPECLLHVVRRRFAEVAGGRQFHMVVRAFFGIGHQRPWHEHAAGAETVDIHRKEALDRGGAGLLRSDVQNANGLVHAPP